MSIKRYAVLSVLSLILLSIACAPMVKDHEFTIRIAGTHGLQWQGGYMVVSAQGQSVSTSVDGRVPAEYKVKGAIVSVSFQKMVEAGTLRVEIWREGKLIAQSETKAPYGIVAVATP